MVILDVFLTLTTKLVSMGDISTHSTSTVAQRSKFWFEDATLILNVQDTSFKVHGEKLSRASPKVAELLQVRRAAQNELVTLDVPAEWTVNPNDLETLLESIYHDNDMYVDTLDGPEAIVRLCALLRVSSAAQLDVPSVQKQAHDRLEKLAGSDGIGALDDPYLEHAEDALGACILHNIPSIRKRLLYTVATTSHFEEPTPHPSLPPTITTLCSSLQDQLIAHFTPILFTVATASHMNCTDVFAETWMPEVIGPALANSGLCRPVETLRMIQNIPWEQKGLCADCCEEKREEWEDEIRAVWEKVDGWI